MPAISVIIPVHNGETTIRETVESVLKQTFTDFELLIVNDGSTDKTAEVLANRQDPRIRIFNITNSGTSEARNHGLRQAQGRYIAILDADDLWTPDKLESQYQALEEVPMAGVAYSITACFDETGVYPVSNIVHNGWVYDKLIIGNFLSCGSSPMFRKSAVDEVGGFNDKFGPCADWDYYLRMAARFPFVGIPKIQVYYRLVATSQSGDIQEMERTATMLLGEACSKSRHSEGVVMAWLHRSLIIIMMMRSRRKSDMSQVLNYFGRIIRRHPLLFLSDLQLLKIPYRAGLHLLFPDKFIAALKRVKKFLTGGAHGKLQPLALLLGGRSWIISGANDDRLHPAQF